MMLPVSRLKGHQPVAMVTAPPWPSLSISGDPASRWLWLAGGSGGPYQATPPLVFYPPTVWIPEHTHFIQWERPAVELVPLLPPFYHSSPLTLPPHPLPKLTEGWICPEEVGMFQRQDKPLLLTNQIIRRPGGHTPRNLLLLSSRPRLPGVRRADSTKRREPEPDSSSSSSSSSPLQLLSVSPLLSTPPAGGVFWEWAGPILPTQCDKEVWPILVPTHIYKGAWLQPLLNPGRRLRPPIQQCVVGPVSPSQLSADRWPVSRLQVMKEVHPSFFSQFASRFTVLTNCRHQKRAMAAGRVSYGRALLLRAETRREERKECVNVSLEGAEEEEEGSKVGRKDKRPVASTPVPGSPWCVVWTGDDRVFFFNPTIHLSVWERPGELIGRDISRIIEDPPHKRKKTSAVQNNSSCSSGRHDDDDAEDERNSKRNRLEEPMSVIPSRGDVKLLPLELRIAHFRDMMLERGVSAFSSWEKELHKMVFDSRYLLLTSDQRKQVFDQFVKSRVKEEYKEKKTKLLQAREEFKQLLEEAKITSRSTFKEFCGRYRGDQRFRALNRKKEQEALFNHYINSLKKRDKENRVRLRKMR